MKSDDTYTSEASQDHDLMALWKAEEALREVTSAIHRRLTALMGKTLTTGEWHFGGGSVNLQGAVVQQVNYAHDDTHARVYVILVEKHPRINGRMIQMTLNDLVQSGAVPARTTKEKR